MRHRAGISPRFNQGGFYSFTPKNLTSMTMLIKHLRPLFLLLLATLTLTLQAQHVKFKVGGGGDVNPLASEGTHHRQEWYGCACCPSNVARFLPSIGGYVYGTSEEALWVNLFIGGEATMKVGGKKVQVEMRLGVPTIRR